jgi:hypothetical protein
MHNFVQIENRRTRPVCIFSSCPNKKAEGYPQTAGSVVFSKEGWARRYSALAPAQALGRILILVTLSIIVQLLKAKEQMKLYSQS